MDSMDVKDLKMGDIVIFKGHPFGGEAVYIDGSVISVNEGRKTVTCSYLWGLKGYVDEVPFTNMFAKYDKEHGEEMQFDNIYGPSILIKRE